ncbi:Protein gir2 [Elasticomyces elasticus]|uniref:Protein gir2 n=1 Tax=Exophiala sideris TaxID=1016849 RepID=A0ABR0J683_9EURO|nr:Protein gir2 [Elasticomyces elasticus]KAK5028348.1 Protein gir2 [Exophiala sideris]KAK5036009.1 Protein gir2 [Exophiala sideris]KAK5057045.1 Protein gir2 [Exophiala sideris]KAK5181452.1 Protein gir2 [Eurotiomycetes sp. CCFEE 6388]
MGVEEQKEEREVLDSIFPDEITDLSDTSYRISIALDVPGAEHEEEAEPPILLLNVTYPEAYPDVAPHLDVTTPPNAEKHPQLDIQEDKAQLLDALQPTIEDSLGMAMVFTLVTTLKEAAETLISDRLRQAEAIKEVAARQKEEEENRKFHGALVTRERFLEWREKFRKDMEEKERRQREEEEAEDKKKRGPKGEEKKLSGRQLWERGLVGKIDEEDIDGDDAVAAIEKLKVEA